jgi:hypothetical protein
VIADATYFDLFICHYSKLERPLPPRRAHASYSERPSSYHHTVMPIAAIAAPMRAAPRYQIIKRLRYFEYLSSQALAISTASSGVSQAHIGLRARSASQVVPRYSRSSTATGDGLDICIYPCQPLVGRRPLVINPSGRIR